MRSRGWSAWSTAEPDPLLFLQRFYEIQAPVTGGSKDNGYMMATNLVGVRESWGRSRVAALPVAINLLYALEPVAAALCLICLSPLLVILALAIRAASGASPLVAHRRVGRQGKTLWVYKFRSMWPSGGYARGFASFIEKVADDEPKPKLGPDPRVTSGFAAFCRRHSLDELPQLALVAAGRMSLVGPRPITRFELHEYYDADATEVLSLKPGLTGLWQIRGRSRLTYRQRKRFDLFLVRRFSVGLYFRIVALTIPDVLFGRDAW
jgi:lipopolysaccharide/colanic/teichoic acid biosynthesis glycosyltransferase